MWKSVCNGHCVTNLFQLKEFIFYGFYSLDDLRFADKPHKSEPRKESLHTASESSESVCIKRFASYPAQITLINTYINVYVCVCLDCYSSLPLQSSFGKPCWGGSIRSWRQEDDAALSGSCPGFCHRPQVHLKRLCGARCHPLPWSIHCRWNEELTSASSQSYIWSSLRNPFFSTICSTNAGIDPNT